MYILVSLMICKHTYIRSSKINEGQLEAQVGLGGQTRSSGGSWGRKTEGQASFGVDLGSVWGDSGQVPGFQGRAPDKFRGRFLFFMSWQEKYENLLKKHSFSSGSAETGAE